MAKESNKERALTLEAIRVLDAIDRRGSFAAAADELGKVPSALSYTVQKLEDELDAMLFDRSGHRTKFTPAGRMLLERGRVLLEAAEHLVGRPGPSPVAGRPTSPSPSMP
jgi:DNA-binding transcriptional LysR family regulator